MSYELIWEPSTGAVQVATDDIPTRDTPKESCRRNALLGAEPPQSLVGLVHS